MYFIRNTQTLIYYYKLKKLRILLVAIKFLPIVVTSWFRFIVVISSIISIVFIIAVSRYKPEV